MIEFEPSPLNLLRHHRNKDDPSLSDAVILTFNHDLSFFEREALGLLQLTGARLTVVGDASATGHDLYAIHRAGTSYLPGLAACTGAFHPKLVALVAEDATTVVIWSGNLTLAGWRGNDELWSIHRARAQGGSNVPAQVGEFLSLLPDVVKVVPAVAEVFRRVGAALASMPGDSEEHKVVSSLQRPIIDQLPVGPVDELLLYAPFHDAAATAVRRLIERLQPNHVRIGFQPESTLIHGPAVSELIAGRGTLFPLANSPYRHGKLIEWSIGERRWALTGSPNLSVAALLRSALSGGNVELGVISPLASSLMPDPAEQNDPHQALPTFRRRPDGPSPRDLILSALGDDGGVAVTLARPLSQSANVDYSLPEESPERWRDGGGVLAGDTEYLLALVLPGGTRLRFATADGSATPVVFVTNLAAVNRVRSTRRLGPRTPEIGEVLADPDTAEKFWSILRAESVRLRAPHGTPRPTERHNATGDRFTVVGDWQAYLDRCRSHFGPGLLSFALGVPELQVTSSTEHRVIDWDSDEPFDDEVGALEDDDPDTTLPDDTGSESVPSIVARMTEAMRAKYRIFAQRRSLETTTTTEPHETLVALRLLLLLLLAAGEVWPSADLAWTEMVLRAVEALERCEGDELEQAAGSLAALALAVVDHAYAARSSKVDRVDFKRAARTVSHLLVAATSERIEEYRTGLNRFSSSTNPTEVLRLRELLVNDDPLELSFKDLDDAGVDYRHNGSLLVLNKVTSNPLLLAREVSALLTRLDNVAVRAAGRTPGQWAAMIRSNPDSIEIRTGTLPRSVMVHHVRRVGGRLTDIAETNARQPVPAETLAVLARLNIVLDDLHDG